jgi:hypothetical protein
MATAPFIIDTTDPMTTASIASFPANEQTNRGVINSWISTFADPTTGYAFMPLVTTTQKNALVTPPPGMPVYDTTLGHIYVNTGTAASPTWTQA